MISSSLNSFFNPDDCREFPLKTKGARLFKVIPADGGAPYWRAKLILNGDELVRRFTSEAHARWWLAALDEPRAGPNVCDYEERTASLRSV